MPRDKEIFIEGGAGQAVITVDLSPPDEPNTVTFDLNAEDVEQIIDRAFRLKWLV